MHSMHGLFRTHDLELGRDEDTGGQIVYVLELAKALSQHAAIDQIDILTRHFHDPDYPGYTEQVEQVNRKVRLVRIPCGPNTYVKKVNLWPYLDQFVKNTRAYITSVGRVPDVFQSNYADSGLVCSTLAAYYKRPQVHTGHSLGIPKMKRLGVTQHNKRAFAHFHFDDRVRAEQRVIDTASRIVTSTRQEQQQQYAWYRVDRTRDQFRVIPPGIDLKRYHPPHTRMSKKERDAFQLFDMVCQQHFKDPRKRLCAVVTRFDKRKNIHGLIQAYGKDKGLQRLVNLLICADTLHATQENLKTIRSINRALRTYNLYGRVALPCMSPLREHEVPALYRYIARHKGVFVNPALIEPFGLTVIEASACGVPVLATQYGGPSEIITEGENGLLIDVKDHTHITTQIKRLVQDNALWTTISRNAQHHARKHYTWRSAAKKYLAVFAEVT